MALQESDDKELHSRRNRRVKANDYLGCARILANRSRSRTIVRQSQHLSYKLAKMKPAVQLWVIPKDSLNTPNSVTSIIYRTGYEGRAAAGFALPALQSSHLRGVITSWSPLY